MKIIRQPYNILTSAEIKMKEEIKDFEDQKTLNILKSLLPSGLQPQLNSNVSFIL